MDVGNGYTGTHPQLTGMFCRKNPSNYPRIISVPSRKSSSRWICVS